MPNIKRAYIETLRAMANPKTFARIVGSLLGGMEGQWFIRASGLVYPGEIKSIDEQITFLEDNKYIEEHKQGDPFIMGLISGGDHVDNS